MSPAKSNCYTGSYSANHMHAPTQQRKYYIVLMSTIEKRLHLIFHDQSVKEFNH